MKAARFRIHIVRRTDGWSTWSVWTSDGGGGRVLSSAVGTYHVPPTEDGEHPFQATVQALLQVLQTPYLERPTPPPLG